MLNETIHLALGWTLIHSIWQIGLVCLLVYVLLNTPWLPKAKQGFLITAIGTASIGILAAFTFFLYMKNEPAGSFSLSTLSQTLTAGELSDFKENLLFTWLDKNLVYLSFAWISGFLVYSIRLIGGLGYLGLIRRKAVKVKDQLILDLVEKLSAKKRKPVKIAIYLSEKVLTPMTFGFYRVSIVFPLSYFNHFSLEETEIILAHEIAHILRYDYLINLVVSLIKTVFYFHPGIWWLCKTLENEREKATDLLACQISNTNTLIYAKTLLKVQEIRGRQKTSDEELLGRTSLALPLWRSNKQLLARVEHVLGKSKTRHHWAHRLMSLVLFLGIFSLLSFTQIILPRSEKMLHPLMEYEEEPMEEVIRVEAFTEKHTDDSLNIEIQVQVETQNEKRDAKIVQIKRAGKEEQRKEKEKRKREVRVLVTPEAPTHKQEEIYIIGNSATKMPTIKEDSIFRMNYTLTRRIQKGEKVKKEFWKQHLSMDSVQDLFPFEIDPKRQLSEAPKTMVKEKNKLDSLLRFEYHTFLEKTEHNKDFQKFYTDILSWESMPEDNTFFERADSLVFQYKLDKNYLENLKMEGFEHIDEFRFKHFPVDENRIQKIIYIEKG